MKQIILLSLIILSGCNSNKELYKNLVIPSGIPGNAIIIMKENNPIKCDQGGCQILEDYVNMKEQLEHIKEINNK